MKGPRFVLLRSWKLLAGSPLILSALLIPELSGARTHRFPDTTVIKGTTLAGHPFISGGLSFDEQRAMERVAQPYNLKLVFSRRAGTPACPAFLVIGANNGRHIEKISLRGPWFYIQLPPGAYTILARFERRFVLIRDVYLWEGKQRTYIVRGD
jgi:hypothetical protein